MKCVQVHLLTIYFKFTTHYMRVKHISTYIKDIRIEKDNGQQNNKRGNSNHIRHICSELPVTKSMLCTVNAFWIFVLIWVPVLFNVFIALSFLRLQKTEKPSLEARKNEGSARPLASITHSTSRALHNSLVQIDLLWSNYRSFEIWFGKYCNICVFICKSWIF